MPSSLIIVALAAAWLVVLVPMIARKRQEVAHTADSALAARVVRSGHERDGAPEEDTAMSEDTSKPAVTDDEETDEDLAGDLATDDAPTDEEPQADHAQDEPIDEESAAESPEPPAPEQTEPVRAATDADQRPRERRYRPGRGGFDPEAAELAARAKYAFRQRVVLGLLIAVVLTAAAAGFVTSLLWWGTGATGLALVGYLAYLRRQVRIENDIRERRLKRLNATRGNRGPGRPAQDTGGYRRPAPSASPAPTRRQTPTARPPATREHRPTTTRPTPSSRLNQHAVVVDVEDEDPAFHELDEPGQRTFRRASGE